MSTIITIVEGQGEVSAVPILIRRIAAAISSVVPQVPKPIRVKRHRLLKEHELERYVDLAARQAGPDGRILIILDADDDCPPERASEILQRATAAHSDCRVRVVLAQREYEAWFLAAADSIAGHRELRSDTTTPSEPESIRDAKGWRPHACRRAECTKKLVTSRHLPRCSISIRRGEARGHSTRCSAR